MRRFAASLAPRAAHRNSRQRAPPDLRRLRDEHVASAREKVFGIQGNMPGDRNFRKKLEGRELMRWYFPSKFSFQDFRVDEYYEMQAERFAPRTPHKCISELNSTAQKVAEKREELRTFFRGLDEETFLNNPTLQDLYGVFRMVDPDPVLSFPVPETIFAEHSPLWGASPPFQYPKQEEALESDHGDDSGVPPQGQDATSEDLLALWALVSEKIRKTAGSDKANALDAQLNVLRSEPEVRAFLLDEAKKLGIVAPFEDSSVVLEDGRLVAYLTKAESGGSAKERADAQAKAEEELEQMRKKGAKPVRDYLARRHRFVDPMFRRRRLKWLERQMAGKNGERETKFNTYYATHPDNHKEWPTNKGSVTVKWPSPHHGH
mmetsp:Transcript_92202/g.144736  ORF Transcript_92202/g.144736 Transcript_92202/m.144736 type:complete len:376 (+) Transcript_92202:110-1237(+)